MTAVPPVSPVSPDREAPRQLRSNGYTPGVDFCFLLASERSGSNLITRLLDGNGRVCGPSPTHLFRILLDQQPGYGDLRDPRSWGLAVDDVVALHQAKLGEWNTSISRDELLEDVPSGSLSELLSYPYEKESRSLGKSIVFVKENHLHRHFAFLDTFFEDAKFVFLVRDPRDMALSWKKSANLRGAVVRAAETWQADQSASLARYQERSHTGRMLVVRYEDLVADVQTELTRICSFIGIEFEDAMLHLERSPANRTIARATNDWANLEAPVIPDNFQKFRAELTPLEVQYIESCCSAEMKELGYALEYPTEDSTAVLRESVMPMELHEKPQYLSQPESVRARQVRQYNAIQRIRSRSVDPTS